MPAIKELRSVMHIKETEGGFAFSSVEMEKKDTDLGT